MNRCFVKDCVTGLPGFYVPNNDPSIIAQWVEAIPRRERAFDPDSDQICAAHFASNVITKEPVYILSGGALKIDENRTKTKLVPGAVPTIFKGVLENDVKSELAEVVVEEHEIVPRITNVTTVEEGRNYGNYDGNDFKAVKKQDDALASSISPSDSNKICQQPQQLFEKVPEPEVKHEQQSRPASEERTVLGSDMQDTAVSTQEGQSRPLPLVEPEPPAKSAKNVKAARKSRKRPLIKIKSLASITESSVDTAELEKGGSTHISTHLSDKILVTGATPSPPLLSKGDSPCPDSELHRMRKLPPVLQREGSASEGPNALLGPKTLNISCRYRRTVNPSRPRYVRQAPRKILPRKPGGAATGNAFGFTPVLKS